MLILHDVPEIKGHPAVARWLAKRLLILPGVQQARAHPFTGRIGVEYEGEAFVLSPKKIQRVLRQFTLREVYGSEPEHRMARPHLKASLWRAKEAFEIGRLLKTDFKRGLPSAEIQRRLERFGTNRLPQVMGREGVDLFIHQFQNPSSLLLAGAIAAAAVTGGLIEAGLIFSVVALNGAIGYVVESQSERSLKKLGELGPREAWVLRDGHTQRVAIETVVPGDILVLLSGSPVVADARLIRADHLSVDESILTGESFPVSKSHVALSSKRASGFEMANMVFRGSAVVGGRGYAVVVGTGRQTEAGQIQATLGDHFHHSTSLQRKLDRLNRDLIEASLGAGGAVVLLGMLHRNRFMDLLRTGISMAVAAVPEGLPTVSTWALSRAVLRLLDEKVLVRDLQAIETLGTVETICLDKTGTLTENKMRVYRLAVPDAADLLSTENPALRDNSAIRSMMACAVLCNDASQRSKEYSGSPTELALHRIAAQFDIPIARVRQNYSRYKTQYRTEKRQYMITWHKSRSGRECRMAKGNPEQILSLCQKVRVGLATLDLSEEYIDRVKSQNRQMAESALRVLGFAYQLKGDWIFLGLMGIKDSPREEIKEVLKQFHEAGIQPVIITGDQASTAEALARELELTNGEPLLTVDMKGQAPSRKELRQLVGKARVFARVAPRDKKKIIEAFRATGRTVAMVGDGINDAPALKAAHVGIAIGQNGSVVAREVAGIVLLDEDLSHLLATVAAGRTIGKSLRKSVRFLVTTNLSEIAVVLGETLMGLKEVLDPLQLLWVNLVTDTLPALALTVDQASANVLKEPPPSANEPLLRREGLRDLVRETTLFTGLVMAALLYGHARKFTKEQNQTIAIHTVALSQMLYALSCYSEKKINWRELLTSHRQLVGASVGSFALHVATSVTPGIRRLFHLKPLAPMDFMVNSLISWAGLWALEAKKAS